MSGLLRSLMLCLMLSSLLVTGDQDGPRAARRLTRKRKGEQEHNRRLDARGRLVRRKKKILVNKHKEEEDEILPVSIPLNHPARDQPAYPKTTAQLLSAPAVAAGQHVMRTKMTGNATAVPGKPGDAKRFLSLFTIVSFANDACTSVSGVNGTCYSRKDCLGLGGTPSGSCASGFGTCCLVTATCGDSTNINGTFFTSLGYPSTFDSVGSCQLTVNKASNDVCQLRLDIENMVLAQPDSTDHKCESDQFIVTGGAPIPAICGTNTGVHMYVDMGLSSNSPVVLTVVTAGASFSRSFSVKVQQIECYSLAKASTGCLQYFTGVSGKMFSFNYNDGTGLQLSDTDYTVCVRMERNFCGIQYTACADGANDPPQSFSVTGGTPAEGSRVGTQCETDWLTIPCATNTNDPTAQDGTPVVCVDRICGMVFNSATTQAGSPNVPVYSFSKPFNIFVHTDSSEGSSSPAEANNRGFCLDFIQQPCTASTG